MKRFFQLMALVSLLAMLVFLTNCGDDEGAPQVVTQLILVFTPQQGEGTEILSFTYRGDAIDQNVITKDEIILSKTTLYNVELRMQSEIGISPIDLSAVIRSEGDEWQVFYNVSTQQVDWNYADSDINGLPIGIDTRATISGAGSGTVIITVNEQRVQENGTATKVSGYGIADGISAPGETKIQVTFNLTVE